MTDPVQKAFDQIKFNISLGYVINPELDELGNRSMALFNHYTNGHYYVDLTVAQQRVLIAMIREQVIIHEMQKHL